MIVVDVRCVIPTHAREGLLIRALNSVAAQHLAGVRLEIVVVDDTSSPQTRELVESWNDKAKLDLTYLPIMPSVGSAGESRNAGANTQAAFLAFLDDDDEWEPNHLQKCIKSLIQNHTDLAISWTKKVWSHGSEPGLRMREDVAYQDALRGNPGLTGSNFVIRREAYLEVEGFDPSLRVSNDLDFLLRFLRGGGAYSVLPEYTVRQHVHGSDQLTDLSEARASGLLAFVTKYDSEMSRSAKRAWTREIASIRRRTESSVVDRLRYLAIQIICSNRLDLAKSLSKMVTCTRDPHSRKFQD